MQIGDFYFEKINETFAKEIFFWKYPPPYTLYNCDKQRPKQIVKEFLTPDYHYYSVCDEQGELIAFRCFGEDAQVPGGDYCDDALDMGGGLKPELTGQGLGPKVMKAAFELAYELFSPPAFRVTVASFNKRALRACEKLGYSKVSEFRNPSSKKWFTIMLREAEKP